MFKQKLWYIVSLTELVNGFFVVLEKYKISGFFRVLASMYSGQCGFILAAYTRHSHNMYIQIRVCNARG